jgi:hypothetical protein
VGRHVSSADGKNAGKALKGRADGGLRGPGERGRTVHSAQTRQKEVRRWAAAKSSNEPAFPPNAWREFFLVISGRLSPTETIGGAIVARGASWILLQHTAPASPSCPMNPCQ